jgi:hypothetical protein
MSGDDVTGSHNGADITRRWGRMQEGRRAGGGRTTGVQLRTQRALTVEA